MLFNGRLASAQQYARPGPGSEMPNSAIRCSATVSFISASWASRVIRLRELAIPAPLPPALTHPVASRHQQRYYYPGVVRCIPRRPSEPEPASSGGTLAVRTEKSRPGTTLGRGGEPVSPRTESFRGSRDSRADRVPAPSWRCLGLRLEPGRSWPGACPPPECCCRALVARGVCSVDEGPGHFGEPKIAGPSRLPPGCSARFAAARCRCRCGACCARAAG
jgi:hypothetical protein